MNLLPAQADAMQAMEEGLSTSAWQITTSASMMRVSHAGE